MKKFFPQVSAFLLILVMLYVVNGFIFGTTIHAQINPTPTCNQFTGEGCGAAVNPADNSDPNPGGGGALDPAGGGGPIDGVNVSATIDNPFSVGSTLYEVLEAVINNIILPIGGILAVLAFIFSGFLYVTAQGNETKLEKAHRALLYSAVGTAVLLGAWVIAKVIEATIKQLQ